MALSYPSSNDYRSAFQHIRESLVDDVLKNGMVKTNALGPQIFSGNFAYAFEITSQYRIKYAVRCFRYDSADRQERYRVITAFLKNMKSFYFIDFEYQREGIVVNGVKFPIVKMAWVDGDLMGQFIEENHTNRRRLRNLMYSIMELADFIEREHFAHGDIQPGNIIVQDDGKDLRLIDYDGMYVAGLKSFGNAECGVPNFQHPKRGNAWSDKLDRFSLITLYVALNALSERHSLWGELKCDSETIIFSAADFEDPKSSKVFKKLYEIESIAEDIKKFELVCKNPFGKIPSLRDFIAGRHIEGHYHTSRLMPVLILVTSGLLAALIYSDEGLKELLHISKPSQIQAITEEPTESVFTVKTTEKLPTFSLPKPKVLTNLWDTYSVGDYAKVIKNAEELQKEFPDDMEIALSLVMAYAMSGLDDESMQNLVASLKAKRVDDGRLYFAQAVLNWRAGDIDKAAAFINLAKDNQYPDSKMRTITQNLDSIIRVQSEVYNNFYKLLNVSSADKDRFALLMLPWENQRLYNYMESMYKEGFIGFSAEYPYNTRLSVFGDWFNAYSGYVMAKSLVNLAALRERLPKNNRLNYQFVINLANLHLDGREGKCGARAIKYDFAQASLGRDQRSVLDIQNALSIATDLTRSDFSESYGYYALASAHYANKKLELAKEILDHARARVKDSEGDMGLKIAERLRNINAEMACNR